MRRFSPQMKMATETSFEYTETASSGSLSGEYLWSDPNNWSSGLPVDGESVAVPYDSSVDGTFDDIPSLSVSELTLDGGSNVPTLEVSGTLAIGTLATSNGEFTSLLANSTIAGSSLVTIGSMAAAVDVVLNSYGTGALIVDSAATDTGSVYDNVDGGGVIEFTSGSPSQEAAFDTPDLPGDPGGGTYVFENPGSIIYSLLNQVDGGAGTDSIELPGSAVLGVTYDAGSMVVVTNLGTYDFANVDYTDQPLSYTSSYDASTQLVKITFTGGTHTFAYTEAGPVGDSPNEGYLWSDPNNWTDGVVPPSGDSITVPYDSQVGITYDDIGSLSVSELTLVSGSAFAPGVDISGTLNIGTLATSNGEAILEAESLSSGTSVVTVGAMAPGVDVQLASGGPGALLVDSAADVTGSVTAIVTDGGMIEFTSGVPIDEATYLAATEPGLSGGGIYAFENPGSINYTEFTGLDGAAADDSIELPGTAVLGVTFGSTSMIVVTNTGTYDFANVGYVGPATAYTWKDDQSTGLVEVTIACYRRGTHILTPAGECPIEQLEVGDLVSTKAGASRPIKWIGRRSYGASTAFSQDEVMPIVIQAGALSRGIPRRDLHVSPHHAMYLDGALVEAHDLTNGLSIYQLEVPQAIEYFHLELDTHDVLFAEGAASESYVEEANRAMFDNFADYVARFDADDHRHPEYCAPRLGEGWGLEAIRVRLLSRARSLRELSQEYPQVPLCAGRRQMPAMRPVT